MAAQEIGWSRTDLGPLMNGRPVFTRALHPVNLLVRYRAIGQGCARHLAVASTIHQPPPHKDVHAIGTVF